MKVVKLMPALSAIPRHVSPHWTEYGVVQTNGAVLSRQISWPVCRAVQSKPGLKARIVDKGVFEFKTMLSQVSPHRVVYLDVQATLG